MGENCKRHGCRLSPTLKILGITFSSTIDQAVHERWAHVTRKVKAQAKYAYGRDMSV